MHFTNHRLRRDQLGGALILLVGLAAAYQGSQYDVGNLGRMGPGFFPVGLGILLSICGLAIALSAQPAIIKEKRQVQKFNWRAWGCIIASIASFVILGQHAGLAPATFAIVFIAALGDRDSTFKSAAILAIAATVVCTVIFWWALKIQLPLFALG